MTARRRRPAPVRLAAVLLCLCWPAAHLLAQTPQEPPKPAPTQLQAAAPAIAAGGGAQTAQNAQNTQNTQPIEIQADSGIVWEQNQKIYIARGNAVATRGPTTVHADVLVAHYREAKGATSNTGGNTQIYRVDASGHVVLTRNGDTVVGDQGVYDLDQGVAVITGKGLKMTTPTDTITARDSFDWYDAKQIAVARGDAVAVRNNGRTIRADVLTGYLSKAAPAPAKPGAKPAAAQPAAAKPGATPADAEDSKLTRMDAAGHVVVTNGSDVGQGKYAVYNAVSGIVTLIDDVVITRGKDVIRGQYAVMDLNTNVSRMMPRAAGVPGNRRVTGLFVRQDSAPAVPGAKSTAKPGAKPQ